MSAFKHRATSTDLGQAIKKLTAASGILRRREAVKPHESKRINEAFKLLSESELPAPPASHKAERQEHYRKFLQKVRKTSGDQMVTLCAVGLGQSVICGMRELVRLHLPERIQEKKADLECDALKNITDVHLVKGLILFLPYLLHADPRQCIKVRQQMRRCRLSRLFGVSHLMLLNMILEEFRNQRVRNNPQPPKSDR